MASDLDEFARSYATAWCSQNSDSVASFFAEDGSLSVNDGRCTAFRRACKAANIVEARPNEDAEDFRTIRIQMRATNDMILPLDKHNLSRARISDDPYSEPKIKKPSAIKFSFEPNHVLSH
jgi:hypothetical protein